MHFGYRLHMECLEDENIIRNISLSEVPSKFYIGDSYLTQICIAPYVSRSEIKETRVVFENPMADAILKAFETFNYLILEVDNYYFSLWKTEDSKFFYFFDGYQKRFDGYLDPYIGFSILFSTNIIDYIIEIIVNRILKISKSSMKVHGLKIIYLKKLTKQEMKSKKRFKVAKSKCIRPFSAADVEQLNDVPSTVDSVAPILSKSQQEILSEKLEEKPQHLKITDLNSPSLALPKQLAYHEIMKAIEKKISMVSKGEIKNESIELMRQIHSDILKKVTGIQNGEEFFIANKCQSKIKIKKQEKHPWCPCGKFIGTAEKVLVKTDLDDLMNEREIILNLNRDEEKTQPETSKASKPQNLISHFQNLPDGTKIICGTKSLYKISLNPQIYDYENFSILAGVSAIIASTRYRISSWSSIIVDYILGCAEIMSGIIELKNRMDFYTHDEHILPKIHMNKKFYNLAMKAVMNGYFKDLENCLLKAFKFMGKCLQLILINFNFM